MTPHQRGGVVVVGPGARFMSGISYYTAALANAFAGRGPVCALLLDRLCPAIVYPGRDRIGQQPHSALGYLPQVEVRNCLDWFWFPRIILSLWALVRARPRLVVLTWWTGTALHTYVLLAAAARVCRARVVIEFHETFDVGEARIPGVKPYVRAGMRVLEVLCSGGVVHSRHDQVRVRDELRLRSLPLTVVYHGPYDVDRTERTQRGDGTVRYLFFGVQRSYKGLDELADAFAELVDGTGRRAQGPSSVHLTVAGEHWGECGPARQRLSVMGDLVTFVDGYVDDDDVAQLFTAADVVVLPYRRSAASGPLHMAMAYGLPVVTTSVPALEEVVDGYAGAVLAEPGDSASLADAMRCAVGLVGGNFDDPHSWDQVLDGIEHAAGLVPRHRTASTGSASTGSAS